MSEGLPYADIVILGLLAVFILLRLRSVLGDRSGNDNNFFTRTPLPAKTPDPIVQLDDKSLKSSKPKPEPDLYLAALSDGPIADSLRKTKELDPSFTASSFLQGAKMAFEMVFDAFAKGDRQTLKMLMSDTVYQHFSDALDTRIKEANKTETTLVSVLAKDITQATLDKNTARLSVRFQSEQVTVVRGAKGEIVEGNPSEIHHVEDHWMFERDMTSKNPNWKIIET